MVLNREIIKKERNEKTQIWMTVHKISKQKHCSLFKNIAVAT